MAVPYRLLFAVIIVSVTNQYCIVRGDALVHYMESKFVECPLGSYQVEFSSNCTDVCPAHAPYKVFHLCMDICPVGRSFASDCSSVGIQPTSTKPVETTATRCRKGFCSKERPYCFNYQCVSDCPHGTVIEDFSCVYHCSNRAAIVYNNSCVTECPPGNPYNESGICVSQCSTYNVLHGNVCVRACPVDMFLYHKTCKISCPQEAYFVMDVLNTKFCMKSCPDFTSVEQHVCQLHCPKGVDFLWNSTCVRTCPASAPLIYVLKRRLPQFNIPICISTCPDDMFSDGVSCVKTCDQRMYVFNSTCVDSCPSSHSLLEGGASPYTCVSECQSTQYSNDNYCTTTCPDDTFEFNRTCISKCPISSPLVVSQTCLSQCPNNLFNESGVCVRACTKGHYIFNNSCVKKCPETHKYINNRKCNNNCSIYNLLQWNDSCIFFCPVQTSYIINHTCVAVCPPSHPFYKRYPVWQRNYCVSSCSDVIINPGLMMYGGECKCAPNFLSYNMTCVEKCPSSFDLVYDGACMERCPKSLVVYNGTCRELCPENTKYINDGLCTDTCPSSHPYYATVPRRINTNLHYQTYCLDTCTDSNKSPGNLIYNMTCVRRCPNTTVLYGAKCIVKCPLDKPRIYTKEDNGKYTNVCVETCPGTTFTWRNYCYDQCPELLASYSPNRTCLEQCPKHRRFRYRFRTNGNNFAFKCKTSCDKHIVNNITCVDVCPLENPFLLGQKCVTKCRAPHMFIDPRSKRCLAACKLPLVELNHTCITVCPANIPFVFNNTCVEKCPSNVGLTSPSSQGPTCVNECKPPLLRENNTCIPACTDKFIINNICEDVFGCPNEYKYIEHSPRGKICRKVCLDNEFIVEEVQCTKKCPKFAVEKQCVDNCPDTHPYTFEKYNGYNNDIMVCHSVCPKLTFGKYCVNYCPGSYLVLQSNKTCVRECPPSDPIKTYDSCLRTCTGTYSDDQNTCTPMSPGYIIAITLLAVISMCCLVGAYLMFRKNTCCMTENKGNNVEHTDTSSKRDTSTTDTIDASLKYSSNLEMLDDSRRNRNNTSSIEIVDDSSMYRQDTSSIEIVDDSSRYGQDTSSIEIIDDSSRYNHDTAIVNTLGDTSSDQLILGRDAECVELSSGLQKEVELDQQMPNASVTVDIIHEQSDDDVFEGEIHINEETYLKESAQ